MPSTQRAAQWQAGGVEAESRVEFRCPMKSRPRPKHLSLLLGSLALLVAGACSNSPSEPCPGPFDVDDPGVVAPQRLEAPQPEYTEEARRARVQGVVIVEGVVDCQGTFRDLRVVKGLPLGLNDSALDALARWRFLPATRNGSPVSVRYRVTIEFRLQ